MDQLRKFGIKQLLIQVVRRYRRNESLKTEVRVHGVTSSYCRMKQIECELLLSTRPQDSVVQAALVSN